MSARQSTTFASSVHAKAIELARMVVEMTTEAGSGHPSSATSLAHIVTVLVYSQMRFEPREPDHPHADRLVLSEGHACPILYAAGADLGFAVDGAGGRRTLQPADLQQLRAAGSPLEGHPNPRAGFLFSPTATGSLGQGLSMAAGLALAARMDGIDKRIYCIVGDGESREGQVWEALDLLLDEQLYAVCPIFNCNGMGQTGAVSSQQSAAALTAKLAAFGFEVLSVDGHDPDQLRAAFAPPLRRESRPVAVVAQTIKGWGSARLQGDMHGKTLSRDEALLALQDLDRQGQALDARDGSELRRRTEPVRATAAAPADTVRPAAPLPVPTPTWEQALATLDRQPLLRQDRIATRQAHGIALQLLGRLRPDVVVLDADVANSTLAEYFARDQLIGNRFVQCRIGEQNMLSAAVGLAAAGKVPFVSTFGKFLVRAYDQLEMAMVGGSSLKLVGSHVGVTPAADGPSQMALADVAFCRALASARRDDGGPLLYVLTPCDARSAFGLTMAMAAHDGSCYLRTQRPAVPHVYRTDAPFVPGGANVLVEGKDLAIFAWGYVVHEALEAVRRLTARGIRPTLIDAYSLPVDGERVRAAVMQNGGRALSVEDNYGGGIGSAVAEAVAAKGGALRIEAMTVRRIPHSARSEEDALALAELSADHIVARAQALLEA